MKIVELQYPDEASSSKILDDLTEMAANFGRRGHVPAVFIHAEGVAADISVKLQRRGIRVADESGLPLEEAEPPAG